MCVYLLLLSNTHRFCNCFHFIWFNQPERKQTIVSNEFEKTESELETEDLPTEQRECEIL